MFNVFNRIKVFLFGRPETAEEREKRIWAKKRILAVGAKSKIVDGKIRIEDEGESDEDN